MLLTKVRAKAKARTKAKAKAKKPGRATTADRSGIWLPTVLTKAKEKARMPGMVGISPTTPGGTKRETARAAAARTAGAHGSSHGTKAKERATKAERAPTRSISTRAGTNKRTVGTRPKNRERTSRDLEEEAWTR